MTGALVFLTVLFLAVALRRSALARQSRLQRMLARETAGGKARTREGSRPSRVPFVRRLQEEAWQAGLALRPQDVIGLMLGGCCGGFLLFLLLGQNLVFALGGALVGLFAPRWWIRHQQSQRVDRIGRQLPRALRMWASALRSGMSVQEALGLVVKEVPEPLHQELDRGYRAMVLGASQEEALGAIARRIGHDDFRLVVTAVEVHSELGGNLAERLDSVAETVESRIEARQTVGAKTAQSRMSLYIIMVIPGAFLVLEQVFNHSYLATMLGSSGGIAALAVAGGLILTAYLLARRIVDIPFV